MNRRSGSSPNKRELSPRVCAPVSRQQSSDDDFLRNGRNDGRSAQNTVRRKNPVPSILLFLFGASVWIQWFIAVTRTHTVHNNDVVGEKSLLRQFQTPFKGVSSAKQQEPQRVHQILLSDSDLHVASRVSPRTIDFTRDWLGNAFDNHTKCMPIHQWQQSENSPYSCNLIHELSLDFSIPMGCGNDRCAVGMYDMGGQTIAFKTMRYIKNYVNEQDVIDDNYEGAWMDAVVTERLSSSPLVVDQYANCGLSQVLELGVKGTLMHHILVAQKYGEYMNAVTRLKVGHQVAEALADLHTLDDDILPSVAHNDLGARQYLWINGVYKLFDFDSVTFTKVDANGSACKEESEHMNEVWDELKAPEEIHQHARVAFIDRYKADVWVLGNVLFNILTKRRVFEGVPREEAKLRILAGIHSNLTLTEENSAADGVLKQAIEMAWTQNAEERPSARDIADMLKNELKRLEGKPDGPGVWRVSIPTLPNI